MCDYECVKMIEFPTAADMLYALHRYFFTIDYETPNISDWYCIRFVIEGAI